jgi:hypothetical protein
MGVCTCLQIFQHFLASHIPHDTIRGRPLNSLSDVFDATF